METKKKSFEMISDNEQAVHYISVNSKTIKFTFKTVYVAQSKKEEKALMVDPMIMEKVIEEKEDEKVKVDIEKAEKKELKKLEADLKKEEKKKKKEDKEEKYQEFHSGPDEYEKRDEEDEKELKEMEAEKDIAAEFPKGEKIAKA